MDSEINIISSDTLLSFRLQKINSNYIRYLVTKNSFEIFVEKQTTGFLLKKNSKKH